MTGLIRRAILRFLFPQETALGHVRLREHLPTKAYACDAGWDLTTSEARYIPAHDFVDIPVGIRFELPPGVWIRITGRSSTWRKHNLQVQEGIIDSGFTGPIFIGVHNPSDKSVYIPRGLRLAQAIPHRHVDLTWGAAAYSSIIKSVDGRAFAGFGSTDEKGHSDES